MKIINESKQEKLPIDFITSFVSKAWEEVGNLKASIGGIKQTFSGTKDVEEILQDLVDAYLIAIGQMEAHLDNKNYLDLDKDAGLKEALIESNDEEAQSIEAKKFEDKDKTEIFTELPDYDVEVEQKGKKIEIELEPKETAKIVNNKAVDALKDKFNPPDYDPEIDSTVGKNVFKRGDFAGYGKDINLADHVAEPFDFFVDFDEPDASEPRLTDDDLYGKQV